jgi:hypothetical protein
MNAITIPNNENLAITKLGASDGANQFKDQPRYLSETQ